MNGLDGSIWGRAIIAIRRNSKISWEFYGDLIKDGLPSSYHPSLRPLDKCRFTVFLNSKEDATFLLKLKTLGG